MSLSSSVVVKWLIEGPMLIIKLSGLSAVVVVVILLLEVEFNASTESPHRVNMMVFLLELNDLFESDCSSSCLLLLKILFEGWLPIIESSLNIYRI